mgnify:CR=1 FL=1
MSSEGRIIMEPVYKTLSGKNYMEFAFSNEGELISYQLEMMVHNNIEGLLGCEVLRIDGRVHIAYDITSLIPLSKLFERKVFTRGEFLSLIEQMTALLRVINGYLLDSGGLLFDDRYIYVDPQNLKLLFAYLPRRDMPVTLEPLKTMLMDMIIHQVRFANEMTDNFIQRLIELLKEKELTVSILQDYLKQMNVGIPVIPMSRPSEEPEPKKEINLPVPEQAPVKAAAPLPSPALQPQLKPEKTYETKMGYPSKSYFVMGGIILVLLALGIVLVINKTLAPDNPDFLLSLFGYLLIGGASGYLAYSKLFTPDKKVALKVEKPSTPAGSLPKLGQVQSPPPKQPIRKNSLYLPSQRIMPDAVNVSKPTNTEASSTYVNKAIGFPKPMQAYSEAAVSITIPSEPIRESQKVSPAEQDRTVLLDASTLKVPTLQRVHGGEGLVIPLTHFPFMIGRLKEQVDFCLNNPAIGKMHAELKKTEEGIFVTDMNSRNGTKINGERLEPSREYKLEHGARLTLANEEFIFNSGE